MMSLVSYSSSEDEENNDNEAESQSRPQFQKPTKPRLPSVPESVKQMFQDKKLKEVKEKEEYGNSSEHEGRVRSFDHERGNWATYVYVPFDVDTEYKEFTEELITVLSDICNFHPIETPHISVTKTFPIRFHMITPLVTGVQELLSSESIFPCLLDDIEIYVNEEKTRTFIGLKVTIGHENLLEISTKLDKILKEYRLPIFYENPSFHLSVAWCLGDQSKSFTTKKMKELKDLLVNKNCAPGYNANTAKYDLTSMNVSHLECKSGNKVFHIELSGS